MSGILRSIVSMSAATTLSRLTGFARTMAQTAALGTGVIANSYTLSNTLPNQIYELFMGGLLSSIFIPLLVERLTSEGEDDARRLVNVLFTLVVPLLALASLLGILFAEPLIRLTTDWQPSKNLSAQEAANALSLAILLFRVFALQILFYGLGALAIGVLNSHRRFFLPTFAPVLNNVIVISSFGGYALLAGAGHQRAGIYLLSFGTTLGVAVMSLVLFPAMWRLGYRPRPALGHPSLLPAARLAGPMLVFVASAVGVQAAANYFGTRLGGVEQLWYAFMVFSLPYGVFVVAIATALMPELSERYSRGDTDGYRSALSFGLRTMAFLVVPAAVGMITLSQPIIGLLYERGAFTSQDTASVATILTAYGPGLLGYAAYLVLVRSFYSRQNTKVPAALNVCLLALYAILAYLLSNLMGLPGVALALSASYAALAVLLLAAMRREIKRLDGRRIATALAKILVAGAAMYAASRLGVAFLGTGSGPLQRAGILILVGGVSLGAYLGVALLLRTEELRSAIALLRRRSIKEAKAES